MAFALVVSVAAFAQSETAQGGPTTEAEWEAQLEAWEQEHAPSSLAERQQSQTSYQDLTRPEALALTEEKFSAYLDGLAAPLTAEPGDEIESYLNDNVAVVDPAGSDPNQLIVSSLPLRVDDPAGGHDPVDPELEPTGDGYEPEEVGTELSIPTEIENGIEIGDEGVSVGVEDPGDASTARAIESDSGVFYANVATDVDLIVSPATGGFRFAAQVRSAQSPEQIVLPFELPQQASLEVDEQLNAAEVDLPGRDDIRISPPTALDADGRSVPVEVRAEGRDLILDVDHSSGTPHFPILVDPTVSSQMIVSDDYFEDTSNPWAHPVGRGWSYEEGLRGTNTPSRPYYPLWQDFWGPGTNTGGLFTAVPQNVAFGANELGQWRARVPNYSSGTSAYYQYVQFHNPAVYTGGGSPHGSNFPLPLLEYGIFAPSRNNWAYNAGGSAYNYYYGNYAQPEGYFWMGPTNDAGAKEIDFQLNSGPYGLGASLPARIGYFGGITTYIADGEWPSVSASSLPASGWTNDPPTSTSFTMNASDGGLGIKTTMMRAGETPSTTRSPSCAGWHSASACPQVPEAAAFRQLSFNQASLSDGVHNLYGRAIDVVDKDSGWVSVGTVRNDRSKPVVSVSGGLYDGPPTSRQLHIEATDGAGSTDSNAQSGIVSARLTVEDPGKPPIELFARSQSNSTGTAGLLDSAPLRADLRDFALTTESSAGLADGSHRFVLTVTDAAGNQTTTSWTREINVYPDLSVDGGVVERAVASQPLLVDRDYTVRAAALETDAAPETIATTIDGQHLDEVECSDARCSEGGDLVLRAGDAPAGAHLLKVVATAPGGFSSMQAIPIQVDTPTEYAAWEGIDCSGNEPAGPTFSLGSDFAGSAAHPPATICETPATGERIAAQFNSIRYGTCAEPGARCLSPVEVQSWPACVRAPGDYELAPSAPYLREEMESLPGGARVFSFDGGRRIEVSSGRTTVVISADEGSTANAALSELEQPGGTPASSAPPPVLGAVDGRLKCGQTGAVAAAPPVEFASDGSADLADPYVRTSTNCAPAAQRPTNIAVTGNSISRLRQTGWADAAGGSGGVIEYSDDGSSACDPVPAVNLTSNADPSRHVTFWETDAVDSAILYAGVAGRVDSGVVDEFDAQRRALSAGNPIGVSVYWGNTRTFLAGDVTLPLATGSNGVVLSELSRGVQGTGVSGGGTDGPYQASLGGICEASNERPHYSSTQPKYVHATALIDCVNPQSVVFAVTTLYRDGIFVSQESGNIRRTKGHGKFATTWRQTAVGRCPDTREHRWKAITFSNHKNPTGPPSNTTGTQNAATFRCGNA